MTRSTRRHRAIVALLVVAASAALVQAAYASRCPTQVPSEIAVPAGNKAFLVGHAVGVQIYTCDGTAWGPATPRANLYGHHGKLIATHFAGPTWQARDGSTVVGRREAGVTVDASAIQWLRLAAASTAPGPDGDRLAHTTYIQRIATTGGLTPPAADCTPATAGTQREVPYTADYVFWKKAGRA